LKEGVVDSLGALQEALSFIDEMKLVAKAGPGMSGKSVLTELKREMYRETLGYLEDFGSEDARDYQIQQRAKRDAEERQKKVAAWASKIKAKL
jgi:t-SNARE complex subunit (syntaxin)